MTTLADKAILLGVDKRPPMLEKDMYDSWKSKMKLYMMNRQHGRMILESVENGLPQEVYALVSNHKVAKELWERIQLLMQGTSLTKQEREYPRITEAQTTQNVITHNAAYQANDLDAYDSNCDEINTAQVALMANLSHYGFDDLAEVHNQDNVTHNMINQAVQAMSLSEHSTILNQSETEITSDSNIIPYSQYVINCTKINLENKSVNETLTAELERYKDQVRILKEGHNVDLKSNDIILDSCAQSIKIDNLKQTLSEHLKEKESLKETVTLLKNDFQKEESRNIDREIALEKQIKELNTIFKRNQSTQTVHMLTKPQFFYNHTTKQALGRSCTSEHAEVYYECKEPFKSLKCLWVRSKSIAATWLEKMVTPLIEPAIKDFAAASAVLKPKCLKVDSHGMSEPISYYLID
uniref:Integrase, catalytic region, zinc finger, CCHC-type, peptidase aspartic, catalytic n=1 Tax=Tanacetum cinerariifolium TaxID=118510 RepID=A0A6L2K6H1_TANCI|nr:hypothetical protein [Tanacetum cinerariifolium]